MSYVTFLESDKVTLSETLTVSTWTGNLNNLTTALYLCDTVVGGQEDPQFVDIKNHSYLGINKILIINIMDDSCDIV